MPMRSLLLIFAVILLCSLSVRAADPLEEYFYASGKIRVVITVAAVVMSGLLAYVIWLDRRLKRAEKKEKQS
jgi:uncharacterized iron-regulated membrane protein